MSDSEVKQQVRNFYDQIGWRMESDGFYQNARYEDLRPVAKEYIEKCHLRINKHLVRPGKYLLDAGSGPIQYPAYLSYMEGYQYRLCMDISIVALQEARKRIGDRGLFVVGDIANLPFKSNIFDGIVSLHTLHHLPIPDQKNAYKDLYRVLLPGKNAVLVNGWTESKLMIKWSWLPKSIERFKKFAMKFRGIKKDNQSEKIDTKVVEINKSKLPTGTFIEKLTADRLYKELPELKFDIYVWRSISVPFLRAVFHRALGGKFWLKMLYALEENYPEYFGKNGQYPLIVVHK
ncbi:MAG: class I SAM-dependent methyltransferase [Anaerolineaceae bacterium]|nr:class I SAM-dependent methyltransferase [Anaerolineaceae bacterium]